MMSSTFSMPRSRSKWQTRRPEKNKTLVFCRFRAKISEIQTQGLILKMAGLQCKKNLHLWMYWKTTESYDLNGWTVHCVTYIFKKILPKKKKKPTKIDNLASFSVQVRALIGKRRILKIGVGTYRQFLMNLRASSSKFCQASFGSRSNLSFPCLRRLTSPFHMP